jgi:AcrR family transcriptional regulator
MATARTRPAKRSSATPSSRRHARETPSSRRHAREQDIVSATRALFDERGMQDAPIEEIARAVGINRALIYRHFSSKEELFVLTVTRYLREVHELLADLDPDPDPVAALREASERFTGYCLKYPAFLDCALSLMRRPARDLRHSVSGAVWFRLGQDMGACLGAMAAILARGMQTGDFPRVKDPDFTANQLYTQALGAMHLARIGVGVRLAAPGVPVGFEISPERVRQACLEDAIALVGAAPGAAQASP